MSTVLPRGNAERTGLGARLREAREHRNLTLQALAERTKIPAANLDAIETEQVHKLPGGIFARSFVRAYAREVGLDPEEAVRDFLRAHPEHAPPDAQDVHDQEPIEPTGSGSAGRLVVVIVAFAVLVVAGFVGYRWLEGRDPTFSFWSQATSPDASVTSRPPAEAESSQPSARVADQGLETGDIANVPAPSSTVVPPDANAGAPTTRAEPAVEPQAPPVPTPSEPVPVVPTSGIRLEIHPSAPCWVRVSADGRVRIERLVQPGERPVVVAAEGIQLQVGDAGAFDYTINGQRGRPLGPAGRVVRVEIARDTVTDFVAR
ncbi:MAG: cytoskeletal protein RodZ [Acidobacteria bacterium]|nr:cytoskeletal protein RodZ [Acidobacteriota bacterium]